MPSILFRLTNRLLGISNILRIKRVRNFFWDLRANDINKKWGHTTGDYNTLTDIISRIKATKILDFGCGNGRLFPLYQTLNIKEVVGQDISAKAVTLAMKKYSNLNCKLFCCDIKELDYPEKHFDLIISNRSLSAVPPYEISTVMNKLCGFGKYIYLNELSDFDQLPESSYWHKHDYVANFSRNNFRLLDTGTIKESNEKWFLFESIP